VRAEPLARITVLISGRGSNLGALLEAIDAGGIDGAVTQVISNRADARGLDLAKARGIATRVVEHRAYADRAAFDDALQATIEQGEPDLVVLAGFMRVLGEAFVRAFDGRLLNIHPSLLPLYPGLHTHRRALADGVRVHGCTVHFVTPTVDVPLSRSPRDATVSPFVSSLRRRADVEPEPRRDEERAAAAGFGRSTPLESAAR